MPRPAGLSSIVLTASVELLKDDLGKPLSREAVLQRAFGDRYTVQQIGVTVEAMTHLDTADWRLRKNGIDLAFVPSSGQLVAHRGSWRVAQRMGQISWPALISSIPDGPVRDVIGEAVWVRALLPFATSQDRCDSFAVLDADAKTVARVRWREGSVQTPQERRLPVRVQVDPLRGYAADAVKVERRLTRATPLAATRDTWFESLWAMPGLGPSATERFGMQRSQAADLAVADALLGYLAEIESNVWGIVADIDTEYLHEFRVAVRRTRSVLKLLGDVLPDGLADRMAVEFRWLGDVTSPTRDLDVYLLGIDDMAQLVAGPGGLDAFAEHVRKRRAVEHRTLARALKSARFVELCATWRLELAAVMSAPPRHRETAAQLAEERLHRIFRKATKRAKAITRESPSEQVHSLRKTCKEMRYLLEVFKPLCNPKAYKDVISDFKELQGVLGDFQDGEVQAAALREFAQEMKSDSSVDADTLLAMGKLSARFEVRQRRARDTLTKRHETYLGKRASTHVDRLLKA
jgi:CHAD domain-containing protein